MSEQKESKRSCLYDIGWIKQKGEWLNALRQFAGQSWVDVNAMNATLLRQIHYGTAFLNEDCSVADSKESAAIIRLKTGVYSDPQLTGEQAREVIIGFHRNQYGMWVGLDFDWGEVRSDVEIGSTRLIEPLFRDVFFEGRLQSVLPELADVAVDEVWQNDEGEIGLLVPYLKHTYERLFDEKKCLVSQEGKLMTFNSGLVSRKSFDPIVVLCDKNTRDNPKWKFRRFLVWNQEDDSEIFRKFDGVPYPVDWLVDVRDSVLKPTAIRNPTGGDILETVRKALQRSVPHLLLLKIADAANRPDVGERVQRLADMWKNKDRDSEGENSIEMRQRLYQDIIEKLGGADSVVDVAIGILRKAFGLSLKLLAWDGNSAVPMYVTSKKDFSFMLPLDFKCINPEDADMAIVLEPIKTTDGFAYMPKSLLELKYAYSNARLISRPTAFWVVNGYRKYLMSVRSDRKGN